MKNEKKPVNNIQHEIFTALTILAVITTLLTAAVSTVVNLRSETMRLDQNIQNIARAVAGSQIVTQALETNDYYNCAVYLDSLHQTLSNVDVISVVGADNIRRYHTDHNLCGTLYEGTLPDFPNQKSPLYVTLDNGPSGPQRRAYAAIFGENGNYLGFVIALTLNSNINKIIMSTIAVHLVCAAVVIICAVIISRHFSGRIKKLLLGYEPDIFTAMFSVRDNILESLEEGIIAADGNKQIVYMNKSAEKMLKTDTGCGCDESMNDIISRLNEKNDIITDYIPIKESSNVVGNLCILRDRTEFTKLMEELSGVKYMVECMRANNHDFTNKLHVILGLIQMNKNDEACEYITHITSVRQNIISYITKNIEDSSLAALLIGKYSRAAELNINFNIETSSRFIKQHINIPSCDLVTIAGNLIDNAMDAMNDGQSLENELSVGIFTEPGVLLINVDDTGNGISDENIEAIFQNGFSTKGEHRGTGLFAVKSLTEKYGGEISVSSDTGIGTTFTVTITRS